MSAYSPPTRRIPSCSSDYPQCEAEAHTLFPLPSHQIKTQNLSFLKRHRQIFSFRVLKRQILLPFAQKQTKTLSVFAVALHPEGVDRNAQIFEKLIWVRTSPSTRRAWIEISIGRPPGRAGCRSPSTRRAWIEIPAGRIGNSPPESPSTRRAWIEMTSPHLRTSRSAGRPPPGGRG